MARLQYENTAAPDFRSSMQGYQLAGDAMQRALGSAGGVLAGLRAEQSAAADNAVMLRALQQQDSGAYKGALESGQLLEGIRPNQVSSSVLAALDARRGLLQGNESRQQSFDQNAYTYGRGRDMDARMDAAGPAAAALADAAARGNISDVNRIRTDNQDVLSRLNPQQAMELASQTQGLLRGELGQRTGEFGLGRDKYNLGITQRNDQESRAAQELALTALRSSGSPEDARAFLESRSDVSPAVRALATAAVESRFPGAYGALGGGQPGQAPAGGGWSMGGGQGVSAGAQSIPFAETRDYVSKIMSNAPALSGTPRQMAEQLLPALIQQESRGRDDAVSNKGARGRTQVMPATGADPGFGVKPMQNQTPQEYERFATDYLEKMLERYDGNPEAALAAYNAGPGNVDKWRSGGIALNNARADAATVMGATRQMQNQASGISADLPQTLGDNRDVATIAQELREGPFQGTAQGALVGQLNKVMKEAGVNAATAGAVLRRNVQAAPSGVFGTVQYAIDRALNPMARSRNLGGGMRLNDDGVDAEIKALKSGRPQNQALANINLGRIQADVENARAGYNNANAQLREATQRAATQPLFREQLPRYQQRAQLAEAALQRALAGQAADPNYNPQFQTTQPVTQSGGGQVDPDRGRTAPNVENMSTMERDLYDKGLLPDYYFTR